MSRFSRLLVSLVVALMLSGIVLPARVSAFTVDAGHSIWSPSLFTYTVMSRWCKTPTTCGTTVRGYTQPNVSTVVFQGAASTFEFPVSDREMLEGRYRTQGKWYEAHFSYTYQTDSGQRIEGRGVGVRMENVVWARFRIEGQEVGVNPPPSTSSPPVVPPVVTPTPPSSNGDGGAFISAPPPAPRPTRPIFTVDGGIPPCPTSAEEAKMFFGGEERSWRELGPGLYEYGGRQIIRITTVPEGCKVTNGRSGKLQVHNLEQIRTATADKR